MRYMLCFFPLVGVVIGALQLGWVKLAAMLEITPALFGAVAVLIPIIISGGIHMDGWIDTVDALSSRADTQKKRKILKDPHVGAFGVLGCALYLLLQWGLFQELYIRNPEMLLFVCAGYVLSRSSSALSIISWKPAEETGLVGMFYESAAKIPVGLVGLLAVFATAYFFPLPFMMIVYAVYVALHEWMCRRQFGGNNGDLAGFLLQNVELLCLVFAVINGIVAR